MKTSTPTIESIISHFESVLNVCNKQIEHIKHPEIYGCILSNCNSIVINKERLMTITTDNEHMITYEFNPTYPTYFTPKCAERIVKESDFKDNSGNPIQLNIIGKLEYYELLKNYAEKCLSFLKS